MQHTYVSSVVLQFHLQNVLTIASVYYTYVLLVLRKRNSKLQVVVSVLGKIFKIIIIVLQK
jgi:hypothetical protein